MASNRVQVKGILDTEMDPGLHNEVLEISVVANDHQESIDVQFSLRRVLSSIESTSDELGVTVLNRPAIWTIRVPLALSPSPPKMPSSSTSTPPVAVGNVVNTETHKADTAYRYDNVSMKDTPVETPEAEVEEESKQTPSTQTPIEAPNTTMPSALWIWLSVMIPVTIVLVTAGVVMWVCQNKIRSGKHKKVDGVDKFAINAEYARRAVHTSQWKPMDTYATHIDSQLPLMSMPIVRLGHDENVEVLRRMPMYGGFN